MLSNLLLVAGCSLGAVVVLMGVTAAVGRAQGRVAVVDTAWSLGFVVISLVAFALGEGPLWRRVLFVVLVAVWAGRLAWHVSGRNKGKGEDPRYERLLAQAPEGRRFSYAVRRVYATQGVAMWFVSLPIQFSAAAGDGLWWVTIVGGVVWAVGLWFEATGDRQLKEFKADPANKGNVMDRGLWAWTRHPNYFGDFTVWWGLYLVAASAWPGVLTVLSPLAMAFFLIVVTGGRLLEKDMATRPGYPEYQRRTSFFLPRPPRRNTSASG
jgi:steroid 5-alpha reductase family enzyme